MVANVNFPLFMKKLLALTAVAILAGSGAHAAIVFGNLGPSGTGNVASTSGDAVSATDWFAQGFTTGVGSDLLNVEQITLGLRNNNAGAISATVSIWSDSGGSPFSSLYTSAAQTIPGNTNGAKYNFLFTSAPLSAGTSYWIVFSTPNLTWSFTSPQVTPSEQNSSGYSYLATRSTITSGTSWGNADFATQAVSLQATEIPPIPEPGTWATAALLAGGAAFMRWRRRKVA